MKKSMVVVYNTLVSLALALGSISLLQGCGEQLTDAQYVERAREAQAKGEVRSSVINLKNALQQNPANAEARALLGQIYVEIGDGPAAEKELRQALERGMPVESLATPLAKSLLLQGKYAELLNMQVDMAQLHAQAKADYQALVGRAYLAQDQLAEAASLFNGALATKPDAPMALLGKALLAARRGEWDDARRWNQQALSVAPKFAEGWSLQGVLERRAVNLDKAQQAFAQAIASSPFNNGWYRLQRALVCLELKDYQCAEKEAQALRRISPTYRGVAYVQGRIHFDQRRFPEAQTAFEQELKNNQKDIYTLYFLALTHLAQNQPLQAEDYLKQMAALAPEAEQITKRLAQLYLQNQDFGRAGALLQEVLKRSPDDPEAIGMTGLLHLAQGEPDQGVDYVKKAAELQPKDAPARLRLGLALLEKGDSDQGIQELQNAIKLDPQLQQADIALILGYLNARRYDKALEAADALAAKQPSNPAPQNLRGLIYQRQGNIPQARAAFEQALKLQPTFSPTAISLAQLDVQAGDRPAAEARYRRVLEQDQDNLAAMLGLAELSWQAGQGEQAIAWLKKAVERQPASAPAGLALTQAYLSRNEPAEALEAVRRLRDANPDNPLVQRGLGLTQLTVGQVAEAQGSFQKLLELQPKSPEAWQLLATAQRQAGDVRSAAASMDKALSLQPDYFPAVVAKIELQIQARQFDKALAGARTMQAKYPEQAAGYRLEGDAYLEQGNFPKAIAAYRAAHAKAGDRASLLRLSNAQWRAGDHEAVVSALRSWLAAHPQDTPTRVQLAQYLRQAGRPAEAVAELANRPEQEAATPPGQGNVNQQSAGVTQADILLNQTYLQQREFDKAIAAALELVQKFPQDPMGRNLLGAAYMAKGDLAQARAAFEKALQLDPASNAAQFNLAEMDIKAGDRAAAENRYHQVLERDKGNLTALVKLAGLANQMGHTADAVKWLEQAVEANPQAVEPHLLLGNYYVQLGKLNLAWPVFRKAQELNPADPRVWIALGNAQLIARQPAEAVATFRKLVETQPNSAQAHYLLARAYGEINDAKRVTEELEQALRLDPNHLLANLALTRRLAQDGKSEEANKRLQALKQAHPQDPEVLALGGELALNQKRFGDAEAAFQEALKMAPNNILLASLARTQWQAGKKEEALATLENWLKQYPDDPQTRFNVGTYYMALNRTDQAKAAFTKVVELAPTNVLALNNLAWLLRQENPAEAQKYAERALAATPNAPVVKDTLGIILLNQGQTEQALDLLKQAAAGLPDNGDVQYHLALALARSGDKEQARKLLQDVIARRLNFSEKAQAEALLQSLGSEK